MFRDIQNLFPTPVGRYDFSEKIDTNLILSAIADINLMPHGLVTKGSSAFMENEILKLPELKDLKDCFEEASNDFAGKVGLKKVKLKNAWFNYVEPGGIVLPHRHRNSVISGAYYLKIGENGSPLSFENPTNGFRQAEDFDFDNQTDFTKQIESVIIKENTAILFPSWLQHFVESEQDVRIVIGFNAEH